MTTALANISSRLQVGEGELKNIIMTTVMPNRGQNVSPEQFLTFVAVANEYQLNPMTKEIYAFPAKGGGIQPIVSVDGWLKIINAHPHFDGMEFKDVLGDNGELVNVTCFIYRKDRSRPTQVTEYMSECARDTDTWKKWPARMLRHKATIQAARYAFGLSGIIDPDEAERFEEIKDITPANEVKVALPNNESVTNEQLTIIENLIAETKTDTDALLKHFQVKNLGLLDRDSAVNCIHILMNKKDVQEKQNTENDND